LQVSQLAALHVLTQVPLPLQAWQLAVLHVETQVPLPLQVWHWAGSQQVFPQACEPGGQGAAVVVVVVVVVVGVGGVVVVVVVVGGVVVVVGAAVVVVVVGAAVVVVVVVGAAVVVVVVGAAVVVVVGVTHVPFWQVWPLVHVETQAPLFEEHVWHWAALHGAARQVFPQTLAVGQHVPLRFVVPDGQAHVPFKHVRPLQQGAVELQALPKPLHGAALASLAPPRTDSAPASPKPKALRAWRRVVVVASALASSSNRLGSFGSIIVSPEIVFTRGT
jgi:hypothetical protein